MLVDENVYAQNKETEFFEHHGIKGQKWGIRNSRKWEDRSGAEKAAIVGGALVGHSIGGLLAAKGSLGLGVAASLAGAYGGVRATKHILDKNGSTPHSHISKHKAKKQAAIEAHQKHLNDVLNTAAKDPNSLIRLNGQVVTGNEFITHVSNGGLVNPNSTRVYAQQENGKGPYVLR